MSQVRTYDPALVTVSYGGNDINGFADGTFVTVTRNSDIFTLTVGSDGEATRTKSNDRSGRIEIVLQQSSPSNDILSAIAVADELSNSGVNPIQVKDNNGTSLASGESAWIVKRPDSPYGKETDNRTWILETNCLDHFVGGNLLA